MLIDDRSEDEEQGEPGDESSIEDDRLRLISTCCHPAIPLEGAANPKPQTRTAKRSSSRAPTRTSILWFRGERRG